MIRPINRPMITLSIMLATIMQTLDRTIATVALGLHAVRMANTLAEIVAARLLQGIFGARA